MIRRECAWLVVVGIVAGCGDDTGKPIVRMDTRDLREEQARERAPAMVLEPMRVALGQEPVIYDPPADLTLRQNDSLVTAPFGITAGPGGTGGAQADTTIRPPQSTPAPRDAAARPQGAPPTRDTTSRPSP
jgi:hypothetical protein